LVRRFTQTGWTAPQSGIPAATGAAVEAAFDEAFDPPVELDLPLPHAANTNVAAKTASDNVMPRINSPLLWEYRGSMQVVSIAWNAVATGSDVYLFLAGMMLLSEAGRRGGLFDFIATRAVNLARGSPRRLFDVIYIAGTIVTIVLSNDATAIVLTPAVLAVGRRAQTNVLPLLLVCAFVANAASFVLPISNPANLVVYGGQMPALGSWLTRLALPSLLAIVLTYVALRWTQRNALAAACAQQLQLPALRRDGYAAAAGIAATAVALPAASAFGIALGMPTAVCGIATAGAVTIVDRRALFPMLRSVQWSILALVAALFVAVEFVMRSGILRAATIWIENGIVVALLSNLINNLPVALLARTMLESSHATARAIDSADRRRSRPESQHHRIARNLALARRTASRERAHHIPIVLAYRHRRDAARASRCPRRPLAVLAAMPPELRQTPRNLRSLHLRAPRLLRRLADVDATAGYEYRLHPCIFAAVDERIARRRPRIDLRRVEHDVICRHSGVQGSGDAAERARAFARRQRERISRRQCGSIQIR
jgi:arsenical pump membrane protein